MDDHQDWIRNYRGEIRLRFGARAAVGLLVLATLASLAMAGHRWSTRHERIFEPVPGLSYAVPETVDGAIVLDVADPLTFQKLAPNDAYRFNASVPVSSEPLSPAAPFVLPTMAPGHAARALQCLTAAVYYEAASEGLVGQQAVAQVVLNRVRHPAFPNSVCGVVYSGSTRRTGCQFTFTCDGALARPPSAAGWARARTVAEAALSGFVLADVGHATHYHTLWVAPYWSPSLVKLANIGAHTFYRWKGSTGIRSAFTSRYAGAEPEIPDYTAPVEDEVITDASGLEIVPGAEPTAPPSQTDVASAASAAPVAPPPPPAVTVRATPTPAPTPQPATSEPSPAAPVARPAPPRPPRLATPSF